MSIGYRKKWTHPQWVFPEEIYQSIVVHFRKYYTEAVAERLKSLLNLAFPDDTVLLKRVICIFSQYSKWIRRFLNK